MPEFTSDGMRRLYAGDFNHMSQIDHGDGTRTVRFFREGDGQAVEMVIRDMYGPKEELLSERTVDISPAAHLVSRAAEARAWMDSRSPSTSTPPESSPPSVPLAASESSSTWPTATPGPSPERP